MMDDDVQWSKATIAMGSNTKNDAGCELFEAIESAVADDLNMISAIHAGDTSGVSAEHLSKFLGFLMEKLRKLWMSLPNLITKMSARSLQGSMVQMIGY